MECEVKFKIENKKDVLRKLKAVKAVDLGEAQETDIYLGLGQKGVRIRRINKGQEGLLTVKKLVDQESRAKIREELEVKVSNIDTLIEIFSGLGFVETKRKEKIRHTFKLGKVLVLLDRLPFIGYFVELEAASEVALKKAAGRLGFDYNQANSSSYDNLFLAYYIKNAKKFSTAKAKIIPLFANEREYLKEAT